MVWKGNSDRRQQIFCAELRGFQRRLVYLCAARRESETSATSLLPHQRGELWSIRAHAHHLRRRFRADLHGGCTAPKFNTATLHCAVVELIALKGAKLQYITVQNWSPNVFNLVTKRGLAHEESEIKWIDCNIGSRLTMKYPRVVFKGRKSRGE